MNNDEDKTFLKTFGIVMVILGGIAIAALVGANIIVGSTSDERLRPEQIELTQKRTDPVYREVTDASAVETAPAAGGASQGQAKAETSGGGAAPSNLKMGKKVFKSLCHTCHVPGLMGAPKVTDKAAWQQRLDKRGLQTLYQHAIHGFKRMPAKGGDPSLSNQQVKAAVDYMLHKAGLKTGGATQAKSEAGTSGGGATQDSGTTQDAATTGTTGADAAQGGGAAPSNLKMGKQVFKSLCHTCHVPGLMGAPKVADTAAWKQRLDKRGLQTLYHHAIDGFNLMPPKGGDASLSDEQVKAAVDYMLHKAGVKTGGTTQAKSEAGTSVSGAAESSDKTQPMAETGTTETGAAQDNGATQALAKTGTAETGAAQDSGATQATAEAQTSDSGTTQGAAKTDTTGADTVQRDDMAQGGASAQGGGAARSNLKMGKKVFKSLCHTCHVPGLMGAPKVADTAAWKQRLDKRGLQTLYQHAIHGFNLMPPKGGDASLSNEQVKAAVDYMLHKAGVKAGGATQGKSEAGNSGSAAAQDSDKTQAMADAGTSDSGAAQDTGSTQGTAKTDAAGADGAQSEDMAQGGASAQGGGAARSNLKMGKQVFKSLCHTCHVPGLMGAPKVADTAAWKQRLDKRGLQTLYHHAIDGFNLMPPKGGDASLSDEQVKAAVDYMLHKAGVK